MAYRVTLKTALAKARAAYDKGELQCQKKDMRGGSCLYSAPCVVGAALPKDVRTKLDNYDVGSVESAVNLDLLTMSQHTMHALQEIQQIHDDACQAGMHAKERDRLLKKLKRRFDLAYWERQKQRAS